MTEYEAYQEHIRYTHDTYCRIVIRHASFDAARMLAARWKDVYKRQHVRCGVGENPAITSKDYLSL